MPRAEPIRQTVADPRSGAAPLRFVRGAFYPLRGVAFLARNSDLWGWAAAPLMLTITAISVAFLGTVTLTDDLVRLVWPTPREAPLEAMLWWMAVKTLQVALFLVFAVIAWVIGNMIGSPFWDVLAERTEQKLLDRPETPFDWRIAAGDALMSVRHSLLGLLLYALVMGLLLALNLLPGLGTALYAGLSYPITALFLAREVMDIPLSRRRTPFAAKIRFLAQHKALVGGLGTATMGLFIVPLVNILVMPFAVMGGTLLYCHLHQVGAGVPQRGPDGRPEGA